MSSNPVLVAIAAIWIQESLRGFGRRHYAIFNQLGITANKDAPMILDAIIEGCQILKKTLEEKEDKKA